MKTSKKLKARRMWANYYAQGQSMSIHGSKKLAQNLMEFEPTHQAVPVAVIPLHEPTALGDAMVSALTDFGVFPKRKGGRK